MFGERPIFWCNDLESSNWNNHFDSWMFRKTRKVWHPRGCVCLMIANKLHTIQRPKWWWKMRGFALSWLEKWQPGVQERQWGRWQYRYAVWGGAAWSFLGCGKPVEPRSKTERLPLGWHYRRPLEEVCCSQRPSGETSGEGDTQNSCRVHFGCPQGVWSPVVPGEGLHNDQKPRFVQRRIVNEGSAWPPAWSYSLNGGFNGDDCHGRIRKESPQTNPKNKDKIKNICMQIAAKEKQVEVLVMPISTDRRSATIFFMWRISQHHFWQPESSNTCQRGWYKGCQKTTPWVVRQHSKGEVLDRIYSSPTRVSETLLRPSKLYN